MSKKIDMIGKRFGQLVVVKESLTRKNATVYWICKCDCGNVTKPIKGTALRDGTTQSCGCLVSSSIIKRNRSHGMSRTPLYRTWGNMVQRCTNPKKIAFKNYGGRGIKVCDDWRTSFESFYEWSINNGYSEGLSIDRIDPNGNYCPENCRWIPMKEQGRNRRNTILVDCDGEMKTISQIAKEQGVSHSTVFRRHKKWPADSRMVTK